MEQIKKIKKSDMVIIGAFCVLLLSVFLMVIQLFRMNVLPGLYLGGVLVLLAALLGGMGFLCFSGRIAPQLRAMAAVLAVLCAIGFFLAGNAAGKAIDALNEISLVVEPEESENVYRAEGARIPTEFLGGDLSGKYKAMTELDLTKDPFAVYLTGSDNRSDTLKTGNSDVNIVALVHPVKHKVLLISTPRDYFVPNPAAGGVLDKLTHCGYYGIDCSMQVMMELYDLSIYYYAQINFAGLRQLVDAVGGVEVISDSAFDGFQVGSNWVDGNRALDFVRNRYDQEDGDRARGRHQMAVIQGIVNKVTQNGATLLPRYGQILSSLSGMFRTNVSNENIAALVKMQLGDMRGWEISSISVNGTDGREITYSYPGQSLYVMYPDQDSVAAACKAVDDFFAGIE